MNEKKHPLFDDPRLTAFVLGELDASETAEIKNAIDQSPELQAEVEQIRIVCTQLTNEFAGVTDSPQLTSEQKTKIGETIAAKNGSHANSPTDDKVSLKEKSDSKQTGEKTVEKKVKSIGRWRPWAIAACLLILVGATVVAIGNPDLFDPPKASVSKTDIAEDLSTSERIKQSEFGVDSNDSTLSMPDVANPSAIVGRDAEPLNFRPSGDLDIPFSQNLTGFETPLANKSGQNNLPHLYSFYSVQGNRGGFGGGGFGGGGFGGDFERSRKSANSGSGDMIVGFLEGNQRGKGQGKDYQLTRAENEIKQLQGWLRTAQTTLSKIDPDQLDLVIKGKENEKADEIAAELKEKTAKMIKRLEVANARYEELKKGNVNIETLPEKYKEIVEEYSKLASESKTLTSDLPLDDLDVVSDDQIIRLYLLDIESKLASNSDMSEREKTALKSESKWILDMLEGGNSEAEVVWTLQTQRKILNDMQDSLVNKREEKTRKIQERIGALEIEKRSQMQRAGAGHPRVKEINEAIEYWKQSLGGKQVEVTDAKALEIQERIGTLEIKKRQAMQRAGAGHPRVKEIDDTIEYWKKLIDDKSTLKSIVSKTDSWKRAKAVPNATRLMLGDKDQLKLTGMQVNVQIDGFRARVVIDYFYYNDRARQLEGSFKLRLPNEASPYYFAFGESRFDFTPPTPNAKDLDTGLEREFIRRERDDERFVSLDPSSIRDLRKGAWDKVKEAKMVPKQKAAFAYQQTTKRRIDPALVEWAGAGVFNAKVFPLAPHKLHRIVVGYDVNLTQSDDRWTYQLALPEHSGDCLVDVRVSSTDDVDVLPAVELDKFDGTANFRLDNPREREFALSIPAEKGIVLKSVSHDDEPFFASRIQLPLKSESETSSGHAVFLVDTSLSSHPEKFNLWLKMLTRLLKENRDIVKRFNVVFFNVEAYWWKPNYVDNTEHTVDELMKYCNRLALEGATDLYSAIRLTTTTPWLSDKQNARPDLFLLSDGAATWGETNLQLIGKQLESDSIGSLFAYQAGMTGTSIRGLNFLTAKTGGAVFSVVGEKEAESAARAHRNKPWQLVSVTANGAEDILTAGRVQWVYPDQTLLVVGRGQPTDQFEFKLKNGNDEKTIKIPVTQTIDSELAYRAYGQVSVGQLENLGEVVTKISTAYARNFRVTGQTCSLLMLDSEADYRRFNIKPEDDQFVVSAKHCSKIVNEEYAKNSAALADPKELLLLWLKQLESAPQINFTIPTALELALDKVTVPVVAGKLTCKSRFESDLTPAYLQSLKDNKLKYDQFVSEARKRRGEFSEDDAIKVLSNLVEQNPGDLQLLRDVAFMAMEFQQPEQAYPLLKKIAMARPFNAVVYTALAKCLVDMGNVDLAMVFYEIAVTGTFQKADFRKIATTEYVSLLGQIERGEHQSGLKNYARSRMKTLMSSAPVKQADLVITMMWNTDRTDVDLHVIDAAGEECNYQHKKTKMGGQITSDITDGYGPEMFWLPKAKSGRYQIKVNYFGSDNLRSGMRSKVHLNIYRNFGTADQTVERKTVSLGKTKEMRRVAEFTIK